MTTPAPTDHRLPQRPDDWPHTSRARTRYNDAARKRLEEHQRQHGCFRESDGCGDPSEHKAVWTVASDAIRPYDVGTEAFSERFRQGRAR